MSSVRGIRVVILFQSEIIFICHGLGVICYNKVIVQNKSESSQMLRVIGIVFFVPPATRLISRKGITVLVELPELQFLAIGKMKPTTSCHEHVLQGL